IFIRCSQYQRLFTNDYQISTNSYVRNYKQIMQNKPNFPHFSPENGDFVKKQTQNKPNFKSKMPVDLVEL
ncbi:MAG: hypothetical protein ACYSU4_07660, partial [Planctomycetota bacterium]